MSKSVNESPARSSSDDENLSISKVVATNVYEVEDILYEMTIGNKTWFLIKWRNYPMDQLTWEPFRNLNNCHEVLKEYRSKNKIVPVNVFGTPEFNKLFNELNNFSETDLMDLFHVVVDDIPPIEKDLVKGSIAYLSSVSVSSRSKKLLKLCKHNLMLVELKKKRQKQIDRLLKWQRDMNAVCGFNITVSNTVDFEGPPKKFLYVDECVAGQGVTIPNDPPVWCHCDVTCGGKKRKKEDCHFNETQMAYNKHKRVVVPRGTPIYECNKKCSCDETCINRVVQNGPHKNLKLQIFRTENNRGWGVKAKSFIKQGSYVTKYSGEIITRSEADRRAVTHGSKSTYLFDLDYNTEKNDSVYSIDATTYGNISHFINHSCDSNLAIYAVWIDCLDTNLPTLALFASRDISVGEEITFNYMTSVNNTNRRIKCKCLAENCRGYLC